MIARVAAIYDVHGNLPALEAVLKEVHESGAELVLVGGDVIPGPFVRETLAVLRNSAIPTRYIMGNGERDILARKAGVATQGQFARPLEATLQWVADQLTDDDARALSRWPPAHRMPIAGLGTVLFVHATPRSDTEIFTKTTSDARVEYLFQGVDAPTVVCGHTHMPFERTTGNLRVVNAGSVGMPFGHPGADWLLLGPGVELRHTAYDLEGAALRVRATAYPQAEEFAAHSILAPPSESTMLAAFSAADQ